METARIVFTLEGLVQGNYFEDANDGDIDRVAEYIADRLDLATINGVTIDSVAYRPNEQVATGYARIEYAGGLDVDDLDALTPAVNEYIDEVLMALQDPNHPLNR